jgi:hypothetical protein
MINFIYYFPTPVVLQVCVAFRRRGGSAGAGAGAADAKGGICPPHPRSRPETPTSSPSPGRSAVTVHRHVGSSQAQRRSAQLIWRLPQRPAANACAAWRTSLGVARPGSVKPQDPPGRPGGRQVGLLRGEVTVVGQASGFPSLSRFGRRSSVTRSDGCGSSRCRPSRSESSSMASTLRTLLPAASSNGE